MVWLVVCVLLIELLPVAYLLLLTALLWLAGGFRGTSAWRYAVTALVSAAAGLLVGLLWH